MLDSRKLNANTPAVQKHLEFMLSIINRMADECRALKTWCVTIVAATLFVVARTDASWYVTLIALFPVMAFWVLDAYYLAVERWYRDKCSEFVEKLHSKKLSANDLYVDPKEKKYQWGKALISTPVRVFYPAIAVAVVFAACLLAGANKHSVATCASSPHISKGASVPYGHTSADACQTECVSPPEL